MNLQNIPIPEFLKPLKIIKKELVLIFIYVLMATSFAGFSTYMLKPITDALTQQDWNSFILYVSSILIYGIVVISYIFLVRKVFINAENRIEQHLNNIILTKYIYLDNIYTESQGTGRLNDIMKKGISTWIVLLSMLTLSMMMSLFFTIGGLINVFILSKGLFFIFLFGLFIFISLVVLFNNKIIKYRFIAKEISVEYSRNFIKIISSKFEILQNGKIGKELNYLSQLLNKYWDNHIHIQNYIELIFLSLRGFILILRIATFGYVGYLTYYGKIEPSSLISLITAIGIIDITLMFFIENYKTFMKEFIHINKLWNIISMGPEIKGYFTGNDFKILNGDIELNNISFEYKGVKVFDNFSMKIEGGKKTAFVGKSGVGKTTLVKLIAGYIELTGGEIVIDGQKLSETSLKSFYKEIGYLTQESSLFDGTIEANLLYSVGEKVTEEKINNVLKKAKCEFVFDFKDGLKTEIGEKGIMLSGGQKQRLSIAKIFLKNPKILILDEPTSALDSFSEKEITKAIHNLMKGRTIIIIAHRLQTIKECDNIFVIGKNKIIEQGTHEELIKGNNEYKKMVDLQSGTISD